MNAPDSGARLDPDLATHALPYTVSVRGLCEFAAKSGDLDLRFTPSPSAQEGIDGHRIVQSRRATSYRRELPVQGEYRNIVVRGRVDGYDAEHGVLEEIKTCVGDASALAANHRALHWAQAKVYGALLCREFGLPGITIVLVYFDIREQRELPHEVRYHCAQQLDALFTQLCERFLAWAHAESTHRLRRDASLQALRFPYPRFRAGQRDLAKAVFNAARTQCGLLAQAPTGIGKTMATLFAMLKACPREALDKVCFLTAKGSGKALALSALETLQRVHPTLQLRSIELTARDKACEHPDKSCHPESCPLARGFYDRLPAARASAATRTPLTKDVLREIAATHSVCPYYLAQEMTRWCDVIVADYNHYFDRSALVHALAQEHGWRVALLVDEAHNLLDRARAMYSASLTSERLRSVLSSAPPRIASAMKRMRKQWNRIARASASAYTVLPDPPVALRTALQDVTGALAAHFADQPAISHPVLLDLYFDTLAFERALETFGTHSLFEVQVDAENGVRARGRIDATMSVRNLVPAEFLRPRFDAAHCAVLFSATLTPSQFYIDTLGLPAASACVDVPSPFAPEQLRVRIAKISTRYLDRDRSIAPLAELIARAYERDPGNYLVFLSSFDYLDQVAARFVATRPSIPSWCQTRSMSDTAREAFIARFVPEGRGVGFAVLGGVFAEGIDLVGTRLVGAFIATLGLPQVNAVNEAMCRRMDEFFGRGYDYTYLYPGLRKVVQAAGRVIRTESDRGCVWLIDDRYGRRGVRSLLPAWWQIDTSCRLDAAPSEESPHDGPCTVGAR